MVDDLAALRMALALSRLPALVRKARRMPLPDGMELVLRIAADECEAAGVAEKIRSTPQELQRAAIFFVEQVLLAPGSSPHRILACETPVTVADARSHMGLLMRCFHPDVTVSADGIDRSVFAHRVLDAWHAVKGAGGAHGAQDSSVTDGNADGNADKNADESAQGAPPGVRRYRYRKLKIRSIAPSRRTWIT